MLHHVGLQVSAHRIGIPLHPAQALLHPVRGRVATGCTPCPVDLTHDFECNTATVQTYTGGPSAPPYAPVCCIHVACASPATVLAAMAQTSRAMTGRRPGRCVSTRSRLAVAAVCRPGSGP